MKKKISLLFSFMVMLCLMVGLGVNANAAEVVDGGPCGDNVTWTLYNDGKLVISGTGEMANGRLSVNQAEVKKVIIEDGITGIGGYAFSVCTNLESVIIPDSVTSIGMGAFATCESLTEVSIPDGVREIMPAVFGNCTSLTNVTLPRSIKIIGEKAFQNCTSLESITIPCNVKKIDDNAFNYCDNLTTVCYNGSAEEWESITIGENNETLVDAEFQYNPSACETHEDQDQDGYCDACDKIFVIESIKSGNDVTTTVYSDGEVIISGTGKMNKSDAIKNNDIVKNAIVEEGVTNIGDSAFVSCYNLTSVTIPDSVTSIDNHAFEGCENLTSITIPGSVTSIGAYAFGGCTKLTDVVIPNSVTSMGDSVFYGSGLETITLSESLTSIPNYAFMECYYLNDVTIPDSVTEIGWCAFGLCASLEEIVIPASVESIGEMAFAACESLESITVDKDSEYYVNDKYGALYTKDMSILMGYPAGNNQASYSVHDGVEIIHMGVFTMCEYPSVLNIPESVTIIGEEAFSDSGISVINYAGTEEQWESVEKEDYEYITVYYNYKFNTCEDTDNDGYCDVCNERYAIYKGTCGENITWKLYGNGDLVISGTGDMGDKTGSARYWRDYAKNVIIEYGVTSISEYSFDNCENIVSIIIPESVTTIGHAAFMGCYGLTNVVLPDGLMFIDNSAFISCINLESINIPDGVTSIGDTAFAQCWALKSMAIPASVINIGVGAFSWCPVLETITVDKNNEYYSNDSRGVLFNKDKTMIISYPSGNEATSYLIPDSVTTIFEGAFHHAVCLEEITIPDSVTTIEEVAFYACASLKEITIPDSVTTIERMAFENCTNLTSITLPKNITTIAQFMFADCVNLTSITIPVSVTTIEVAVFDACESLTDVYYGGTEEQWNNIEFGESNEALFEATIHIVDDDIVSGKCGDNVTYELTSDGILTISGEGPMWDYGEDYTDIRTYYPPYMSIEVDENDEVIGNTTIKKVVIEDGVTRIGDYAFQACRNLEEVEIPYTVTSIGAVAFDYCTSLKHIKIPSSVKVIEEEAFSESALETIEIEEGLERIETIAFFYCRNLKEVILPESVEYIGDFAFIICDSLETLVINNKDCEIGLEILVTGELDGDGNIIVDENGKPIPTECPTTIKGYTGSTAEEYAKTWTDVGYPIKFEALDAHDHTPVTYTQAATCTVNGYIITTCATCNETIDYEVIVAPGHTEKEAVKENVVDSTYTEAGSYDEVVYCENCGTELGRETKEIPALWLSNISFEFDRETLIISGFGEIPELANAADYPWSQYAMITSAVYLVGINSVSSNAFENFYSIRFMMIDSQSITIKKDAFADSDFLYTVVTFGDTVVEDGAFVSAKLFREAGKTVVGYDSVEFSYGDNIVHFNGDVNISKDDLYALIGATHYRYGQDNTINALKFNQFRSEDIFLFESLASNKPIEYPLTNATVYVCVGMSESNLERKSFNDFAMGGYMEDSDVVIRFCVETTANEEETEEEEEPLTFIEKVASVIRSFFTSIAFWLKKLFGIVG